MTKFAIAATDRASGLTVYGRVHRDRLHWRTGPGYRFTKERENGLIASPEQATPMDIAEAGDWLVKASDRLAALGDSWVTDLRIVRI
jgi:hypothetical protein